MTKYAILLAVLVAAVLAVAIARLGRKRPTFATAEGCSVSDLSGVHEGYSTKAVDGYSSLTINVSAENIAATFQRLAELPRGALFFTLEVGTQRDVEASLRMAPSDPFHTDVYYLDGLSQTAALSVYRKYERLFSSDCGVKFGIGSHEERDEVFVDGYKVFYVYTNEPDRYRAVLNMLGFREDPEIKTVWKTFTQQKPGERRVLAGEPKTIWDMIAELKPQGLYFAERRED